MPGAAAGNSTLKVTVQLVDPPVGVPSAINSRRGVRITFARPGGPDVDVLDQDVTIEISYDGVASEDQASRLVIYNATRGEYLPTTIDRTRGVAIAKTRRFSTFALAEAVQPIPRLYLPTALRSYQAPVRDDFSSVNSGWSSAETDISARGYDNGEYRILVKQANYFVAAGRNLLATDFRAEVDARASTAVTNGAYGLYFGSGDAGFYAYQIFEGGTFRLRQYDASTRAYTTLLGPTSSSAIRTGNQTNRLKVVRRGGTITLFANGQQIGQTADMTFGQGFVGLIASGYEPGFEARFDNFLLVFDADDTTTQAAGLATVPAGSFPLAVSRLEEVPIVGADAP